MKILMWTAPLLAMALGAQAKTMSPKDLLLRLHNDNAEEISLGQLAQQKGVSPKVKAFGEKLVKDHTAADKRLLALAAEKNIDVSGEMPQSTGEAGQLAKQSATSTKLTMKKGRAFDKAFAQAMVKDHGEAIRMIQDLQVNDPEVGRFAQSLLPTLREHQRIAEKLE